MAETIKVLLSWAVFLSHYPAPDKPPRVEFKPHSFFVKQVCSNKPCNVLGWYNDQGIVYLDERIQNPKDAIAQSIWVHEFVHYLQHRSEKFNSDLCADRLSREREAYTIQREYVIQAHGKAAFIRSSPRQC